MIECDHCQNWYHGKCVGITQLESKKIKSYVCKKCESPTIKTVFYEKEKKPPKKKDPKPIKKEKEVSSYF